MCFLPPVCSEPRPDGTLFISGQALSSRGGSTSLSSSDNYFSRCQSLKFSSYCQLLPVNSKDDDWFALCLDYISIHFSKNKEVSTNNRMNSIVWHMAHKSEIRMNHNTS